MDSQDSQYRPHGMHGYGAKLFGVALGLQIVVYFALYVRFFSRRITKYAIGKDDWVISVAVVSDTIMTAITFTDVYYGYGTPGSELSPEDRIIALKMFWLTQIVYKIVMCCCKLSFCLFYLRVFPHRRTFRYVNIVVMTFILSYSVASISATIAQCVPVARAWDRSNQGTCINLTAFWYANAVYSIFTDVVIIIIPCVVCWNLQMDHKEKAGLLIIFSVGIFVIGTSIARITTLDISSRSVDPTHGTLESTFWTTVEANTAIVVACLPHFKAPMRWLWSRYALVESSRRLVSGDSGRQVVSSHALETSANGDIEVTTDVDVEFEEKSRESSLTMANSNQVNVQPHELA